jgi:hypothetical protein
MKVTLAKCDSLHMYMCGGTTTAARPYALAFGEREEEQEAVFGMAANLLAS